MSNSLVKPSNRHGHENIEVINKVADSDGNLIYNGEKINSKDSETVNGHTVAADVPVDAKFTDADTIYDDTLIKQDIAVLKKDSHLHDNKPTIDRLTESFDGKLLYNGALIEAIGSDRLPFVPVQIKLIDTDNGYPGESFSLLNDTTKISYSCENFQDYYLFECSDIGVYKLYHGDDVPKVLTVNYFGQYIIKIYNYFSIFAQGTGIAMPFTTIKQTNCNIVFSLDNIYMQRLSTTSSFLGFVYTTSKVDLSLYTALVFKVNISANLVAYGSYPFAVGFSSTYVAGTDSSAFSAFLTNAGTVKVISTATGVLTFTIDITNYNSSYYIFIHSGCATLNAYDIRLQ